jgi:alpha-tubulin suppressor-like RCC1 family protein
VGGAGGAGGGTQISAGGFTCARRSDGKVRCWGDASFGQLGNANTEQVGATSTQKFDAQLGPELVQSIAVGSEHACAIINMNVICWGNHADGRLGYGSRVAENLGDDEGPFTQGLLALGGPVQRIAVGAAHTCALSNGSVMCWGSGTNGRLGFKSTTNVGDTVPAGAPVDVGSAAKDIAAGAAHTCATLLDDSIRCWGSYADGRLGVRVDQDVGDDETPDSMGVTLTGEGAIHQIAAGGAHSCAIVGMGELYCWGKASSLGLPSNAMIPEKLVTPQPATRVATGDEHTCIVDALKEVRCWGKGADGRLGYGNEVDATLADVSVVDVGGPVLDITAGARHSCALLESDEVVCWGFGGDGRLGYGNTDTIGDGETPAMAGVVPSVTP